MDCREIVVRDEGIKKEDQITGFQLSGSFGAFVTEHVAELGGFQLCNRLFKHFLVEIEAKFMDISRLLRTQQIARTANIKVTQGDVEA